MFHRSATVYALALLGIGLLLAPPVVSAQSSQLIALDSEEIIATTDKMLLRHDLISGELTISFMNGERSKFNLPPQVLPEQTLLDPVLQFHTGGPFYGQRQDGELQATPCASEANTLASAINAVEAACGDNPGSSACGSALDFYQTASTAYANCIFRHYEQMH